MRTSTSLSWLVVVVSAAMLLAVAAACGTETVEVPGETVVVEKEVIKTVEVPGETVVKEVVKEVQVPGETVVVKEEVVKEVMVPGETVVVEKVITETVEVPGETVTVEVVKEVMVPGQTVVVEKEVVKTVEVPGETVVVEKVVTQTVQVPGETVVVEKEVVKTVEVPGQTVVVEKEVIKTVEVPGPERVVVKVEEVVGEKYTRNVWGEVVEIPQYGGTIPSGMFRSSEAFDPWFGGRSSSWAVDSGPLVLERMGDVDWTLPRDEFPYLVANYLDLGHMTGALAKNWDISPDLLTYIFHIREGVHWHDKPPVNGREFTAYDAEFTWHRNFGLGSGYTEPSPHQWRVSLIGPFVESVTAADKYTLVVKTNTPTLGVIDVLLGVTEYEASFMVPPEVIKENGDMKDWRHVIGTGPYEITGFVPGSSFSYTKNPNYWKYDPLYPDLDLRLPYADEVKQFVIVDSAARAAALRTGKIAMSGGVHLTSDQINSLRRTNPELVVSKIVGTQPTTPLFRGNELPFNDKNVRIAMQKAINVQEINFAYYGGDADTTPFGYVTSFATGMFFPYAELPEEVKWQYEYEPAEAERLLDEAGHPRGADGIRFEAGWDIVPAWGEDTDLAMVVATYWDKIGVDVTVTEQADGGAFWGRLVEGNAEKVTHGQNRHASWAPFDQFAEYFGGEPSPLPRITDPEFNALVEAARATSDLNEFKRLVREMDRHYLEEMWTAALPIIPLYRLHQPWLKGYRGELGGGYEGPLHILMNVWVDQELKQDMGH